jgi:putative transposase
MKKKRFSVEQIVAVLKQTELGMPVADLIRQVGISEQTFYRWKKQYAGMQSDQVRELKQLQEDLVGMHFKPLCQFGQRLVSPQGC